MARKDRMGNRKTRDQRSKRRVPEMGYYLVVTDTEATERCFFTGLHNSLPEEMKQKLVIKVVETDTQDLIQKCQELTAYDAQYRIPWIVFDRDQVVDFDQIVKRAEKAGIYAGWSNPCFEIWLFAYFGMMPVIQDSWTCCSKFAELYFRKTGNEYTKADKNVYMRLCEYGNEERALTIAEQKYQQCMRDGKTHPSTMCPATRVYELVREIKSKVSQHV